MKIIFIYSLDDVQSITQPLRTWEDIQFGISYISSVLKADGHETQLIVLGCNNHWEDNAKLLNSHINEFSPDLICFTAVASQYPFIEKVAYEIKKHWPDKFQIIGGVHATLNPSEVSKGPFDAICVGEGEYPLTELCRKLKTNSSISGIPNLWIKLDDGTYEKNAPRPFMDNLDVLPFPDRAMWSPWIKEQRGAELSVLLGRGCPYNCTYCCNHVLKKVTDGKYVRFRSPENIIREIAFLHTQYPDKAQIYFEVESIALDKTWLFELCKQLEEFNSTINNSILYGSNFRISPQSKDKEIFSAFKKANFNKINIGLESGSERVRREILKRNYTNQDFMDVIDMAREVGLKVFVFNIIGIPGETYDDYLETVRVNRQCQPDMHYTGIFFPYPGTELHDVCIKEGMIDTQLNYKLERRQPVINSSGFSKRQVRKAHLWFDYRVYKGYKPLWWLLMQTAMNKVRSVSTLNFLFRKIVQWKGLSYLREKLTRV